MWFSPWRRILRGRSGDAKPSGLRAGTKFVEEDTGVEYTYDPVMKDWKKKVAPYSALVAKDGSTVWAEDASGKTIASGEAGVDDASVIQSAINEARLMAVKQGWVKRPIGMLSERHQYMIPTVKTRGKFIIKKKIDVPPYPAGFEPSDYDPPTPIRIDGKDAILDCTQNADDVVFHFHGEPAKIINPYIEGMMKAFADPNNPTDFLQLEYFHGIIRDIRADGFRRLVVMKTGWDPYFINVRGICYPGDSNLGAFHIIPTDYDNTNGVRLIHCSGLVKTTNGWLFRDDDSGSHSIFFIHFHSHDGGEGDGVLELSQFKGSAFILSGSVISHSKWAIYGGSQKVIDMSNSCICGPVNIAATPYQCNISDVRFQCNPANGEITIGGANISNCIFIGQTTIGGPSNVSACKFYPMVDNQDHILRYRGGPPQGIKFSNILVCDYSPHGNTKRPCDTAILIGTREHDFAGYQPLFEGLELVCYKTKYGIYIESGNAASEFNKIIIANPRRLSVNLDGDYSASESFLIYSETSTPIAFAGESIITNEDKFTFTNKWDIIRFEGIVRFYTTGKLSRNSGTTTFSGDGTTTQFSIAHGLVSTPTKVLVTPMTADAAADFYVTADDTYIYINYKSAPPSGTDNLKFSWFAEV